MLKKRQWVNTRWLKRGGVAPGTQESIAYLAAAPCRINRSHSAFSGAKALPDKVESDPRG